MQAAEFPTKEPTDPVHRERGATRAVAPLALVVEDDARMRAFLRTAFVDQRFRVIEAINGAEALRQASAYNPDLIVLDFVLPDGNAPSLTAQLRRWTHAPILILSTRGDEVGKIAALDAGANDFVTKPFSTAELFARVRVWMRHVERADADSLESALEVGDLRIDFERRVAYVRGAEIRLTPTQYKLLGVMMRNAGKVLTHEQILLQVWGPAYTREVQYLRVYMGKLRQKIEVDPARPRYFVTEPGVGYRLRAE
jgi:two-component system KDP operon response regulator KdpE